jgi:Uma2 family endonuclease
MSTKVNQHLFTIDEYHKMIDAGVFSEDYRVELINGIIIEMNPIGKKHSGSVNRLNNIFNKRLLDEAIVSVQNPIILNNNTEPIPDIILLRPRNDFYTNSHPKPDDAFLIIEVADTSLNYDRDAKIPQYADSLIIEVWIRNLVDDLLEVYREPENGKYKNIVFMHRGQTISPLSFPHLILTIDEILG